MPTDHTGPQHGMNPPTTGGAAATGGCSTGFCAHSARVAASKIAKAIDLVVGTPTLSEQACVLSSLHPDGSASAIQGPRLVRDLPLRHSRLEFTKRLQAIAAR